MNNNKQFIFNVKDEKDKDIELIKLTADAFFYKGEKVEDIHNVYERFNEWLTKAEQIKNK